MTRIARIGAISMIAFLAWPSVSRGPRASDDGWLRFACGTGVYEEQVELDAARLGVDLARRALAAYEEIYDQIARLWEEEAIERMVYLQARYDRDAARLVLEQADLLLDRQVALLEQYGILCGKVEGGETSGDRARAIDRAINAYRKADCDAQAKAIEVAEVNLEFDRQWLRSILELREADVATRPQVILAELEVELEQTRLAEAKRRTTLCRARTERKTNPGPSDPEAVGSEHPR